jgi:hypothetical protein
MIASMAAQGLGAMIQSNATARAEDEKALMRQQNDARNRRLEDEARLATDSSRAEMERKNFDQGTTDAATNLAQLFDANTNRTAPGTKVNANAPKIVQDAMVTALNQAEAKNEEMNFKLAALNSVGDYLNSTISPALSDSAAQGVMSGSFIKGNSVPLSAELNAANRLAYSPMAQLLTAGGRAGMQYDLYSPTGPIST